jgi:hypothetical protein
VLIVIVAAGIIGEVKQELLISKEEPANESGLSTVEMSQIARLKY